MNLVAWFPLDVSLENKGTISSLVISGISTYSTGKVTTSALYITGGHYAEAYNDDIIKVFNSSEFSIACWAQFSVEGVLRGLFACGSSGTRSLLHLGIRDTGKLFFGFYGDDLNTEYTCIDNTWYHLVFTYKNNVQTVYVNGASVGTHTTSGNLSIPTGTPFKIGSYEGNHDTGGLINDFRVYDYALSPKEIKELSKGLALHYNFEDKFCGLTRLPYFESGFSSTFDTDWVPNYSKGFRVEIDFGIEATGNRYCLLSNYSKANNLSLEIDASNQARIWYNNGAVDFTAGTISGGYTLNHVVFEMKGTTLKIICNGVESTTTCTIATSPTYSMVMFVDRALRLDTFSKSWRMYECKIWVENELKYDFVPVYRSARLSGLFDDVGAGIINIAVSQNRVETSLNGAIPNDFLLGNINTSNATIVYHPTSLSDSINCSIFITKPADGWGDGGVTSKTAYTRGYVRCSMQDDTHYCMIGFAPVNNSFNYTQGYFVYANNDGTIHIYEMGNYIGEFGYYFRGGDFIVEYDSGYIRYYYDGDLLREVAYGTTPLYVNITTYTASTTQINKVSFGEIKCTVPDLSGYGRGIVNKGGIDHWDYGGAFGESFVSFNTKDDVILLENPLGLSATNLANLHSCSVCWWQHDSDSSKSRVVFCGQDTAKYLAAAQGTGVLYHSGAGSPNMYKDGVLNASATFSFDNKWHFYCLTNCSLGSWTRFNIGGYADSADWSLHSDICDVKIFATTLSAADVKELYEAKASIDNNGNLYCAKRQNMSKLTLPTNASIVGSNSLTLGGTKTSLSGSYTRLEYISSSGTQWINTGVALKSGSVVELKFESSSGYVFGQNDQGTSGNPYIQCNKNAGTIGTKNCTVTHIGSDKVHTYYVSSVNNPFNGVFGLFCTSYKTPLVYGTCTYYYCRILNNGGGERELVPVKRNSDNAIGMLDLLTNTFYANAGTGTFTAGPELGTIYNIACNNLYEGNINNQANNFRQLQYIEGTGTQWINLDFTISDIFVYDLVFKPSNISTTGCVIGAGTADSAGNGWGFYSFGNAWALLSPGISWHSWGASDTNINSIKIYTQDTTMHTFINGTYRAETDTYWGIGQAWRSSSLSLFKGSYTAGTNQFQGRIYSFKTTSRQSLTSGTTRIVDMIPVQNKTTGEIGMWDRVHRKFYGNSGTGYFIGGPVVSEFIE